jgi:hypothetical protein
MASPGGPMEAILKLLAEELKDVIRALPRDLQDSVPERLRIDRWIATEEGETPDENK